ncbi:hypothetical protein HG535_0G03830 [Zygotorulaspora mrakii]|uniref:Small-subunit processome Utp12 domain-containing protein n=1 Tax=Zygotorulaspora mrakii TaxID=42260 RepID=A0A7H9B7I3_ZYGMR|nr:uncharacterized protein HG535_0G03830 [Zygotorulaspora mrakii]QLG74500.1 hypothetical protein HG535_0G03830 [Zygotorulaspora mrakii]
MVKSYQRFEQANSFGVIASNANCVWIPPASGKQNNPGRAVTAALENVNIWDIKTAELVSSLSDGLPPGAADAKSIKPAETTYLQYHRDTNILAAGYADGTIKIWDLMSKTVLLSLSGHKSAITVLKFDSTGTRMVSGSRDSDIILWDLIGEVGLYKLRSHKDAISGIWMQDDEWLISTSKDGLVKIWDLKTQQCVETHIAHTGECWGLGICEDLAITTGADSQIKIWQLDLEANSGSKLIERGTHEKQSKQRGLSVEFMTTPDDVKFFYIQNADKTIEVFRIRKKEEIAKAMKKREKRLKEKGMTDEEIQENIKSSYVSTVMHSFQVIRSTFKIKGSSWAHATSSKLEIAVTTSSNTVEYYSIPYEKREPRHPVPNRIYSIDLNGHRTDIRAIDISRDNTLLATASNGQLKIWNLKTRLCIRTFECGYALCCKFLPGGVLVIVGTREGELQLFDLASSTLIDAKDDAHNAAIWSLDISYDGKRLVTGSADKTVKFWNFKIEDSLVPGTLNKFIPTLKLSHNTTLELNDDILSVRLSPENKLLAVSLLDNTVKVFFFDTMKFFLSLYGHKLPVLSIDISFDSKLIITSSADKNIKVWGLDFGDCHKSLFAHQDSIMNVKFLPESHNFFSCSKDGQIKYWDGDKFECIQKLCAHQSEVWTLAISSDGEHVVSTAHDHSIRIWEETGDQVFLEEEREKEAEEQYENTLLSSLEDGAGDDMFKKENDAVERDEATDVRNLNIESLKAGERLMEALDLGIPEIEQREAYEKELKKWKKEKKHAKPSKPTENSILSALKKSPEQYIMDVLTKIKPSQLEDALLVLPFSYVLNFLTFFDYVMRNKSLLQNNLACVCRNLYFIVRSNHKELVAQKNEELKIRITRVKEELRNALKSNEDDLGFNVAGLKFIKQQWDLKHKLEYVDEYDQLEEEKKLARKRVFETVV